MATTTTVVATTSSKKRKERSTEEVDALPGPSKKKVKKDKTKKKSSKSKDKLSKSLAPHTGRNVKEFNVVKAKLVLSLAPVFASNPRDGVEEMLDSMIMRYIPSFNGVVLSHSNLQFLQSNGTIQGDSPFATCHVQFDALVWSPAVGMKLSAKVNLHSPDHISLLVHRTFNVSIPRHHIPSDEWEFLYGPAENDPEYGALSEKPALASLNSRTQKTESANAMDVDEADSNASGTRLHDYDENESSEAVVLEDGESADDDESTGKWVRLATGEKVGGSSGIVTFTIIGMTIANQMLSLVGSLQPDPFSPAHVPHKPRTPSPDPDAIDSDAEIPERQPASGHQDAVDAGEDEDDDDVPADPFQALLDGRTKAAEARRKEQEEKERAEAEEKAQKVERKRKRKEERAAAEAAAGNAGNATVKKKKKVKKVDQ